MDSTKMNKQHIQRVNELVNEFILKLRQQGANHDLSKLRSPEKEIFDVYTPKLKDTPYGSSEYKANLKAMGPALSHHYKNNSHHPEHYSNGIKGMNLVDIVEMLSDWRASVERTKDGDILKSITFMKEKYKFSDELEQIFINTIKTLHWDI